MAKFDMNSYARRGAEIRVAELNHELETIFAAFPDLRSGRAEGRRAGRAPGRAGVAPAGAPSARTRRGMTAAQRKAVSARMKRYWAERRKAKEK